MSVRYTLLALPVDAAQTQAVTALLLTSFPGMAEAELTDRFAAYSHLVLAHDAGVLVGALFLSRHAAARRVYWGYRMNGVATNLRAKGVLTGLSWTAMVRAMLPDYFRHGRGQEFVCFARVCNPIAAKTMAAMPFEPDFPAGLPPSAWGRSVYEDLKEVAGLSTLDPATGLCPDSAHEHGIAPEIRLSAHAPAFYHAWAATVPAGSELVIIFRLGLRPLARAAAAQVAKTLSRRRSRSPSSAT